MNKSSTHRVIFMGTPEFAVPSLRALIDSPQFEVVAVVTQPDKPTGRKQVITPSPVKALAQEQGIAVLQPDKVKTNPDFWQKLRGLNPDVMVVAAYGKILPQEVLDIPPKGIVNVHASLSPKYRGASPIASAILNGDTQTGVTIMKLVLAMDKGPIIGQSEPVDIDPTDTTGSLTAKLAQTGADALLRYLSRYLDGELTPTPQDDSQATYTKLLDKSVGQIDWHENEELIARQVRAYSPWPSAYTTLGGMSVKILSAEVAPIDNPTGHITKIGQDMFIGRLKISQLQPAGGKAMAGSAFLAGHSEIISTFVL
ncbi:MAG: methionyl-tRNA formyltransferase, methionyl-tRNA formyltransferase [candidate division Kazan bacterium GW2011_GWA1_50_15]|uniref:Methionyl-tRNA formyltransferase n=2 Tax=Bacteria division Kazan-3B-28 TaxID=1798534 RepID=A0A0G1X8C9_UNCK3|nr:MAG: methionyl-tRNA formyltransferase, methionyl-tRNA formyltransferase [candidate division Kazan bacterium GW2011_GWA1_50_15]KKW25915.1 MAG: Methionyl-tRNA formyltransferase [candidate division Kazan bacterium GW2011_GWC1_52_13]KKW27070.1 MAG: Methionyl-tRNA formyltransferase [candidate division Kazan bacterium GW2011_GWB1_52_7]HAV65929.1 methionyl-tRNA formyltransferase [Patescibacteria group bacterium]HCR42361.1 methionyl-tRNA formyltransferase [Patescibacteria group bacterium]